LFADWGALLLCNVPPPQDMGLDWAWPVISQGNAEQKEKRKMGLDWAWPVI
jgi:hypothetical protein